MFSFIRGLLDRLLKGRIFITFLDDEEPTIVRDEPWFKKLFK